MVYFRTKFRTPNCKHLITVAIKRKTEDIFALPLLCEVLQKQKLSILKEVNWLGNMRGDNLEELDIDGRVELK